VLVIEGGSSDGTRELIEATYNSDHRVILLSQQSDRSGFMNACYLGVEQLESPLATFMYSDDILSPHFVKLAEALLDEPVAAMAFGYGRQAVEDEKIYFPAITTIEKVESERVLYAFYGRMERLDAKSLPVSPVCCVVRSPTLKNWVGYVKEFTLNNPLRQHTMIRLAGGPDIMVYLSALLDCSGQVIRADHVVCQLTASAISITNSGNKDTLLTIGYWQARLWGFMAAVKTGKLNLAGQFSGYLLAVFFFIMTQRVMHRESVWTREFMVELIGMLKITCQQGLLLSMLRGFLGSLYSRLSFVLGVGKKQLSC
jgi:hypothetical protein